ncbi:tetratricopeptide repeat protein [Tuwongella immobilis]|uniref:Soluble lytic transglycosylase domain-containing protein:: TPR_1: TPR_2 n=1 Tax=Tuwongella immobilis TaxID=692036 RepID=A0A6C2YNP1_9BACT|nr:tetratricopeptide repeat protein [Tuwongella immobilis]VIP03238.1 soluble lytic transglycosylase domain-containing protein : : TPR_1: TPR_2 [Tuwongella immobilis]VTS03801.1 soluble lytic transglycosylase domain-containing protein : : TPR_1: TPR_2 [Tuwongella immobilis]
MSYLRTEYMLKGIFLGVLLWIALQRPEWATLSQVGIWLGGGLGAAIVLAGMDQLRRSTGMLKMGPAAVLFLMLEYPMLIYAGILFGALGGAFSIRPPDSDSQLLVTCMAGGAALGIILGQVRQIRDGLQRALLILIIASGAIAGVGYWIHQSELLVGDTRMLGMTILLGLPFFYLLSFSGTTEESEVEIGLLSATLGLAIYLIGVPDSIGKLALLTPIILYFVYATRVLPGLRVFKHTLRGYSYVKIGKIPAAMRSFRRALQLDSKNSSAREGLWHLHRTLDLDQVGRDPELLQSLDLPMCMERASTLLMGAMAPTKDQLDEARRLILLVETQRPSMRAEILYYRALAATHAKELDSAAEMLAVVLDPTEWDVKDRSRNRILLSAWQLALQWHPGLRQRVGEPQLELPGRRMEAIAAVERRLANGPADESLTELKERLYADLPEEAYLAVAKERPPEDFNHQYIEQLGMSLLQDPTKWLRGAAFLRIAARGLPFQAPLLFLQLANAFELRGDKSAASQALQSIVEIGQKLGIGNLGADQKQVYFQTVKRLADEAVLRGDLADAIKNYHLYSFCEKSGIDTYRSLAELYEKQGDVMNAIKMVETGLLYSKKDADLLERKDRYYYSLTPQQLESVKKEVDKYFDVDYCIRKAKQLLDHRQADLDVLDWATHLAELAQIMKPKQNTVMVLVARTALRKGNRDTALQLLEDVRESAPGGGEEEEAWFWACQNLGRIYLDELNLPELAIAAFNDFRRSPKSGADTLYHLGRAYEAHGDLKNAKRCYEQVTAYDKHPLVPEARAAIYRLESEMQNR